MIKLRTNAHDYSIVAKDLGDDLGSSMHDALAAHSYKRAIEARIAKLEALIDAGNFACTELEEQVRFELYAMLYLAAESASILAELLKEAK